MCISEASGLEGQMTNSKNLKQLYLGKFFKMFLNCPKGRESDEPADLQGYPASLPHSRMPFSTPFFFFFQQKVTSKREYLEVSRSRNNQPAVKASYLFF
jgi:hypothetical protein